MRVAVIGAGASGLVTLKYLKTAHQFFPVKPIETMLFESESAVGGTFAHRTYEDAEVCANHMRKGEERRRRRRRKRRMRNESWRTYR